MSKKDFVAGYMAARGAARKVADIAPGASVDDAMLAFKEWFVDKNGHEPSNWYDVTQVFFWLAENGILSI